MRLPAAGIGAETEPYPPVAGTNGLAGIRFVPYGGIPHNPAADYLRAFGGYVLHGKAAYHCAGVDKRAFALLALERGIRQRRPFGWAVARAAEIGLRHGEQLRRHGIDYGFPELACRGRAELPFELFHAPDFDAYLQSQSSMFCISAMVASSQCCAMRSRSAPVGDGTDGFQPDLGSGPSE